MFKIKIKSTGKKVQEHNVGDVMMLSHSEATHIIDNVIEQPEINDKKVKPSAKKIVYTSKYGSKAIFDSIKLVALVFGVSPASVRNMIGKTRVRKRKDDWLKGGSIEYFNN